MGLETFESIKGEQETERPAWADRSDSILGETVG